MFDHIRFVLVETSLPANIGSAARAMKTMGLHALHLVAPKTLPDDSATALAAGADDLLEQAPIHPDLSSAIADCTLVIGMSARARRLDWPQLNLDEMAALLLRTDAKVAILFGSERSGLTNPQLQACHYHVHIPSDPSFSSLNLAAAVQIVAFVLRDHALKIGVTPKISNQASKVTQQDMEALLDHFQTTLTAIQVINPQHPRDTLARLQRLLLRAQLDPAEIGLLHSILQAVDKLGML